MENMIYVCELQAKNMFLFMYAFDPKDELSMNVYNGSFLDEGFEQHMQILGIEKFDVVVMNPPYQELKPGFKKSQALWDKFVIKVIEKSLVEGGYLCAVHPDGWRNVGKGFDKVKTLLKSKQIYYLEVHDVKDGLKIFNAEIYFDVYCLKNSNNNGNFVTRIKCMDEKIERVNISNMEFIPNGMFAEFNKLLAKPGEERVEILHSYSAYETRNEHMSKTQTDEFKYPCIYMTRVDGAVSLFYSNKKENHFNESKVVWSNGRSSMPIIDEKGEYGLTQFAYAIVDEPQNLKNIKKAMMNPLFLKLMFVADGNTGHRFKYKAISLFRKDFWVDFLDYDETEVSEKKKKISKKKLAKQKEETV